MAALLLEEEVKQETVSHVVADGYAPDLTDADIITMGRDPFLIAYALVDPTALGCRVATPLK